MNMLFAVRYIGEMYALYVWVVRAESKEQAIAIVRAAHPKYIAYVWDEHFNSVVERDQDRFWTAGEEAKEGPVLFSFTYIE